MRDWMYDEDDWYDDDDRHNDSICQICGDVGETIFCANCDMEQICFDCIREDYCVSCEKDTLREIQEEEEEIKSYLFLDLINGEIQLSEVPDLRNVSEEERELFFYIGEL